MEGVESLVIVFLILWLVVALIRWLAQDATSQDTEDELKRHYSIIIRSEDDGTRKKALFLFAKKLAERNISWYLPIPKSMLGEITHPAQPEQGEKFLLVTHLRSGKYVTTSLRLS